MKFLLEFVACCGVTGGDEGQEIPEIVGRLSEEETSSLVTVRKDHRRKKRGRWSSTGGNNNSGVEWKPTLSAISENNVVAVKQRGSDRVVKRKGSVRGGGGDGDGGRRVRDTASLSGYVDNYRQNRVLTVIPAFSPTPFMI